MREQLIRYVDLLFAGAAGADDVKQEILQNTLDRYDDLIGQGKTPQAAYSLAIAGIGDLSEILSGDGPGESRTEAARPVPVESRPRPMWKKIVTATAIALYIICALPLIVLAEMGMEVIGLCGTLSIVAVATVALIIAGDDEKKEKQKNEDAPGTPRQELAKAINKAINTVGLVIYFVISFASGAWYITWLVFPIMAAVRGIVTACLDFKEAKQYEK